jgi:putative zinc finger/helix-turn-helix YgiT family protein
MVKKCRSCGKGETSTSRETYLYTESGLPNVTLVGVDIRRCPRCGAHEVLLPRVEELHRVIAQAVVHKPARLSGAEVRFLRKSLGWSGADFAKHLGVDPSTVSKWETDKEPIGPASDRALRLMAVHGRPVDEYPLDELMKIGDERKPAVELRLSRRTDGWAPVAAAS